MERLFRKKLYKPTTQLEALNLKGNYMTQESLRHVWILLECNEKVAVEISRPCPYNWNHTCAFHDQAQITEENGNDRKPQPECSGLLKQMAGQPKPNGGGQEPTIALDSEDEEELRKKREAEAKQAEREKMKQRCYDGVRKIVCYQDYNDLYDS